MEQVIKRVERLMKIARINFDYKLDELDIKSIEQLLKYCKEKTIDK